MSRRKPPPREPSAAEKNLWQIVTEGVKPTPQAPFNIDDYAREQEHGPIAAPPKKFIDRPIGSSELIALGNYANIDKNTAARFRGKDMKIDATLDLHGMKREEAWRAFEEFFECARERGWRKLLIITGKGKGGDGALKQSLPHWASADHIRPFILALDSARADDGGSGAFYLLMRRQRNDD